MLRAVIFDFDGVLVATDEYHFQSWLPVANRLGIQLSREFYDACLWGLGRDEAFDELAARMRLEVPATTREECIALKNEDFFRLLAESPPQPTNGATALIASLKQGGLFVAVGSSSRNARLLLQQMGLSDLFDVIVDRNDVAAGKPSPAIFLKAAELLGVMPGECVVIEDTEIGLLAARDAGMKAVGIGLGKGSSSNIPVVTNLSAITIPWITAQCSEAAA